MRRMLRLVMAAGLLVGSTPAAAGEPASGDQDRTQVLSLPGYEISIEVPACWEVDPAPGPTVSIELHGSSPFVVGMWRSAWDPDDGDWCRLQAYSRLGCAAPVDLEAELAGLDPGWQGDVAVPADAQLDGSMEDATCARHLVTDGVDIFEAWCCGRQTSTDAWRSIAHTLQLPAEPRPTRVAAADRSLVVEAIATTQLWRAVYGPTLAPFGEGPGRITARERIAEPWVRSMVEELGLPPASVRISQHIESDEDGGEVLVVDVIRARGASTAAVRAGMLAWAETEALESGGTSSMAAVTVAGMDASRLTAPDLAGVAYVVAEGDSAARVWGVSDEVALSWLEALPCDYLDTQRIVRDALTAARPDD